MDLAEKMLDLAYPVTLYELVPPAGSNPKRNLRVLEKVKQVQPWVDAFNIPEISSESLSPPLQDVNQERMEPRTLAARIQREYSVEAIVNRVVVHDVDPEVWMEETRSRCGIRNLVLVGGESGQKRYPGPSVTQTASWIRKNGYGFLLGGIMIPSRADEIDRVIKKCRHDLRFFTTQVLFDSNDIVGLVRGLNGLEARIFLSFAPVSHPRDLQFLRRLGVDISADAEDFLLERHQEESKARPDCLERSIELAARIMTHVFENLPPSPPPIGLMVGHINQRNYETSVVMLKRLKALYEQYVYAQYRRRVGARDSSPR